jgi:phosphoadenylyl-sulfate reductase (thioredoxin)
MPLLKDGRFVTDEWLHFGEDDDLPPDGDITVPFARLAAHYEHLSARPSRLGVAVPNSERAEALRLFLPRLGLVILPFPAFTDGRSFSLARQIRGLGYAGELRASGPILPDQLGFPHGSRLRQLRGLRPLPRSHLDARRRRHVPELPDHSRPLADLAGPPPRGRHARTQAAPLRLRFAHDRVRRPHPPLRPSRRRALLEPMLRDVFPGRLGVVSSFGAESAVLLHMVAQLDRSVPVIFLDTGKLFPETLAYRDRLVSHLGLENLRSVTPDTAALGQRDPDGKLHASNPDGCCHLRKVEPLERALTGLQAWVTGRKRFHGGARSSLATLEPADSRLKINPLARWSRDDIERYIDRSRSAAPSAGSARLHVDRLRALHAAPRSRRRLARRPLGGHGKDRMRHPLDGERPSRQLSRA